jgi:NB-ARC domain
MQNLPPKPYGQLVGREEWVNRVLRMLRETNGPPIIALTGIGGIGKTALAYEVARVAIEEGLFKDVLWETAKQYELLGGTLVGRPDAAITKESLLNSFARQLGRFEMLQLKPEERHLRLQYILQNNPYLVVVDNLETVEDYQALVEELSSLLKPSRAILTSRIRLEPHEHIYEIQIQGLSEPAAIDFLRREATEKTIPAITEAEEATLERIAKVTGGLPLAMKFFVAQVGAGVSIGQEVARVERAENEESLYRYIYFDLWSALSIPSQKILVALPAFADSVPRFLLQPVARVTDDEFQSAVTDLITKSLVEVISREDEQKNRYSIHQLTRHFINSDLRGVWEQQKAKSPTM